ncbi:putative LRR receptor-like serine/threonine-protein kinase [Zea mays]|uniref:Putative LRR receptor-like serine/threonine-protein kinase n=1 Tax=Zea mays TaxID=4577 RepID=A0A3L6EWY3_MAIZE|nr:putative LRR receptor-like serine/threonine-protein kinase [Zea mays]
MDIDDVSPDASTSLAHNMAPQPVDPPRRRRSNNTRWSTTRSTASTSSASRSFPSPPSRPTYKGILGDGSVVAVKSLSKTSCKQEESDFLCGLKMLTLLQHDNLVRLRGFCCSRGRGDCFLVYDLMVNGCLSRYLDVKDGSSGGTVLDWPTRVSIVRGIAKGIEYLHSKKGSKPPYT